MDCALCGFKHDNLKRFSDHLRSAHTLNSEQYTIRALHNGIRPVCAECGSATRYTTFAFKEFCSSHAKLAMKLGGKKGGRAEAWNKGQTKDSDARLASYASNVTGSGNHFYGRQHTQETLRKISDSKTLVASSIEQRLSERGGEFRLITPLETYRSRQTQYLVFQCLVCGEQQPKTLQAFERGSRCYKCVPSSRKV